MLRDRTEDVTAYLLAQADASGCSLVYIVPRWLAHKTDPSSLLFIAPPQKCTSSRFAYHAVSEYVPRVLDAVDMVGFERREHQVSRAQHPTHVREYLGEPRGVEAEVTHAPHRHSSRRRRRRTSLLCLQEIFVLSSKGWSNFDYPDHLAEARHSPHLESHGGGPGLGGDYVDPDQALLRAPDLPVVDSIDRALDL
jgi:hypothetical protein